MRQQNCHANNASLPYALSLHEKEIIECILFGKNETLQQSFMQNSNITSNVKNISPPFACHNELIRSMQE